MKQQGPGADPPLREKDRLVLADALGDAPQTVISVSGLRRGLCRAWVAGGLPGFDAAIVQADILPAEPFAFGTNAESIWQLLQMAEGWECVDVPVECADAVAGIMEREMGLGVRHYPDVYHVLRQPAPVCHNEAVRPLTVADLALLESSPEDVQGCGFGSQRGLLIEGIAAGAVVGGRLVAIAHTCARTEWHAEIGVFTLKEWRGRGFATAAATIVAERVQEAGQTPVWSTGEGNRASLRVAQKLGFVEASRRTYLIPSKGDN